MLLYGTDRRTGERIEPPVTEATAEQVTAACAAAAQAAPALAALPLDRRAALLRAVADAIDAAADELVTLADTETALGPARLTGEVARTTGQLRLLADEVLRPDFAADITDDKGPVLRRVLRPIGPVAVYAASNFPFAFSVAGGDTASALAAGCPVVLKAHPGHPLTSQRTGEIVSGALAEAGAPDGTFAVLHGFEAGRSLVTDSHIKAAAFTGSVRGGRALFDLATGRPDPIPFYGELGSINPVFVTRTAVRARGAEIAQGYVSSFTLGVGQFCTKPGLVFLPTGHGLETALADALRAVTPAPLLTDSIAEGFRTGSAALAKNVELIAAGPAETGRIPSPVLYGTTLEAVLAAPELTEECFGPASLIIEYGSDDDLLRATATVTGSLTATVHAEPEDAPLTRPLLADLVTRAGRIIWNGWPTGVAVSRAMHHGGPWPATTNSLYTSVGTTAIARFQIPVVYQDVPPELQPL